MRESLFQQVLSCCQCLMTELLSRLHTAACTPHLVPSTTGKGGVASSGRGLDFALGMQQGLGAWCRWLLHLLRQREGVEEW